MAHRRARQCGGMTPIARMHNLHCNTCATQRPGKAGGMVRTPPPPPCGGIDDNGNGSERSHGHNL
ncbi:hypothetical protein AA0616_1841 [Komagataeibacter nataicola NRIC 0616]|nr:hypothetical protein AA0616_1841 [Komagataeibacter nataicola NRIC 0616]